MFTKTAGSRLQLQETRWAELEQHYGGSSCMPEPAQATAHPDLQRVPSDPMARVTPRGWICCSVSCPKRGLPGQVQGRGWPAVSSVHGILQAGVLEWVAIPFSQGVFPTQGLNPDLLHWQLDSFTVRATREVHSGSLSVIYLYVVMCICQSQSPNLLLSPLTPQNHKIVFYIRNSISVL